jgi:hypothetical protein
MGDKLRIVVACPHCKGQTFFFDEEGYVCCGCGHNIGDDPETFPHDYIPYNRRGFSRSSRSGV